MIGNTLEELVSKLDDTDQKAALEEIKAYNAAVQTDIPFNPNVKDGRCTKNLEVNKSQLGEHARHAALRGLRGHLRHRKGYEC